MAKNKDNQVTDSLATVEPVGNLVLSSDVDFSEDADKRTAKEVVTERYRIVQAMTKDADKIGKVGQLYGNMTRVGFDQAVIVPIFDYCTVVERTGDDRGSFVKEHTEVKPGTEDFGPLVNKAIRAAGKIENLRQTADGVNHLALTYNCYVAFLDATGLRAESFGVLQADKTNIRPYLLWRQNRVKAEGSIKFPTYAFRTIVSGRDQYTNPAGKTTRNYRFEPFVNNNWIESCLCVWDAANKRITFRSKEELDLLTALKEQKALMQSGAIKVSELSDADDSSFVSEDQQEDAAF